MFFKYAATSSGVRWYGDDMDIELPFAVSVGAVFVDVYI
jgi:hypothetical protein